MKRILCTLFVLGACLAGLAGQTLKSTATKTSPPSLATDQGKNIRGYIELLRSDRRKDRSQLIETVMQLDAQDATAFWPIYNDFITEYVQLSDNVLALVKNYAVAHATMTNQVADQFATRWLDLDQKHNGLERKYYWKFKDALGAITAARFLQVENQLDRIIELQMYSELPAIDGLRRSRL
jgi:hypothetical protein